MRTLQCCNARCPCLRPTQLQWLIKRTHTEISIQYNDTLIAYCTLNDSSVGRYGLLGAAAFSQGLSVGPLINLALHLNPSIVMVAFLATAAVFACFSAAAVLSPRRRYVINPTMRVHTSLSNQQASFLTELRE